MLEKSEAMSTELDALMTESDAVVVNEATASVTVEKPKPVNDLENWDYTKYVQYFPQDCVTELTTLFQEQSYGWKSRARLIKAIREHYQSISEISEELNELTFGKRTRSPRKIEPREGLRSYLNSLSLEALEKACVIHSVSFKSFVGVNGETSECIEALCDEMLAVS